MGAGRRTETYLGPHTTNTGSTSATPYLSSQAPFRNLPLGDLAAVIFGCTTGTFKECVTQLIFGLPQPHFRYIQNIQPGLPIFLFSYSDRILHGIFEADSCGELNINPYAWTGGKGLTQFPAQIRVRVNDSCSPLPERVFKPAIIENYQKSPSTHFAFEIDHAQLNRLRSLFKSNTSASNGLHKTSRAGLSSQLNGEDQDGWVTPRKTIKAGLDAWHKAEPFIPTFGQTLEAEDEKRTATPEHWYDYQETIEADKVSENTLNIQGALDDTLNSDVDSRNEESLNWRANMQPSNVVESEGREHSKKERERVVVERLRQLKQKGKQVIVETKAELLDVPGTSNGEASGLVSPEASEVIDFDRTEWEKLARERCLQEQTMLRRVREQLKEKLQAVDEPVARAISMNLELSSSAIAQMRQDEIKLRHLMDQAMSQTELLHELDQLRRKNATLEYTQVKMASEIEGLKSEMSRLSLKIRDIVEQWAS